MIAAALRALLSEGRSKEELAKMAGYTSVRMLDYTLRDNPKKGMGQKAIERLSRQLGMSYNMFLSFGEECLEKEKNVHADGNVIMPTPMVSGHGKNKVKENNLLYNNDPDFIEVGLREATASMGGGSTETGRRVSQYLKFRSDWIATQTTSPSKLSCIKAFGESMSPTITDDSVVLVDEGRQDFVSGKVYYIRHNGQMFIKRLVGTTGSIKIVSDNDPENPATVICGDGADADDFEIIGRVLWMGRKVE